MKIKQTKEWGNGTSFHRVTILTTVNKIKEKVGPPSYSCNDGSDKTNYDFIFELEDGTIFTIYDWKEYRPIGSDERIHFHIGADNKLDALKAKEALRGAGV